MSYKKLLATIQILIVSLLIFGCRKKASDEIDFGTFTNSTYTNRYFAVSATIPSAWSVQDLETRQQLMKIGSRAVAGDDKNLKGILKVAELQTVNLFTAFQHPPGTPVTFNPSAMSIAEKVRQLPGIKKGSDYLFHARKLLESSQMKFSFPTEVYSQPLNGVEFDVMELEMNVQGQTVKQKYYSTIMKGYALCFIISYTNAEEEASVRKILDTVKFH